MTALRPVLQTIYDHLIPDLPVWDLCCDHGLLGIKALEEGKSPIAHFVDQSDPVMDVLKFKTQDVNGAHLYHQDAATLKQALHGNIVISGVGSHTMIKILEGIQWSEPSRLLLSTNNKQQMLTEYLDQKKWKYDLNLVEEGHRKRPVFKIDLVAHD
jgi:tRNA (adenine22-N1)-methyltransferase